MKYQKAILFLSLPLSAMLIFVSCVALLTPGFYAAETINWQTQSTGQDLIDLLLITPCLLISAFMACRNNKVAFSIWGGVVLYLTYTFFLYCFNVKFNRLFAFYCFILGLSFYAVVWFFYKQRADDIPVGKNIVIRLCGIYFIVVSVMFYILWLAEILPAMWHDVTPDSLKTTGLASNGVQVLDLAILLPGIFFAGIGLLSGKRIGLMLLPVLLTSFILMDITIAMLSLIMKIRGVTSDLHLLVIMGVLTLISTGLLFGYFKNTRNETS